MSAKYLPFEIIRKILVLLPHDTIHQCMLVCKSWNASATIEYYSTLKLGEANDFPLKLLAKELKTGRFKFFKHGALVKKLILVGSFEDFGHPITFNQLFLCLPNLKSINITESSRRQRILKILTRHKKELGLNQLQEIHALKPSRLLLSDLELSKSHFFACTMFQKTITHLNLHDVENSYFLYEKKAISSLDLLYQFSQLTSLVIDDHPCPIKKTKNVQFHLPFILKFCPKLIDLRITRYNFTQEEELNEMNTLPLAVFNKDLTSELHGLKLKNIQLTITSLNKSLMEYITSNICTSKLDKLIINKSGNNTFNEFVENQETFLKFIQHISLAKCLIFNVQCPAYDPDGPRHIWYKINRLHRVFWKMINALENEKESRNLGLEIRLLGVSYHVRVHPLTLSDLSCCLNMDKGSLSFQQDIPFYYFFYFNRHGELCSDFFSPFVAKNTSEFTVIIENCQFWRVLRCVTRGLPNLVRLRLESDTVNQFDSQIESKIEFLKEYTKDESPWLLMRNIVIEQHELNNLAVVIPNLEKIELFDCYLDLERSIKTEVDVPILWLDLQDFKKLKNVTINLDSFIKNYKHVTFGVLFKGDDVDKKNLLWYYSIRQDQRHEFKRGSAPEARDYSQKCRGLIIRLRFNNSVEVLRLHNLEIKNHNGTILTTATF